jgi:hypothetical protein
MPELKLVEDVYPDAEPGETDDLASYIRSWVRSLRARNLAAKTVKTYREAVAGLAAHLARTDGPGNLAEIQESPVSTRTSSGTRRRTTR